MTPESHWIAGMSASAAQMAYDVMAQGFARARAGAVVWTPQMAGGNSHRNVVAFVKEGPGGCEADDAGADGKDAGGGGSWRVKGLQVWREVAPHGEGEVRGVSH